MSYIGNNRPTTLGFASAMWATQANATQQQAAQAAAGDTSWYQSIFDTVSDIGKGAKGAVKKLVPIYTQITKARESQNANRAAAGAAAKRARPKTTVSAETTLLLVGGAIVAGVLIFGAARRRRR